MRTRRRFILVSLVFCGALGAIFSWASSVHPDASSMPPNAESILGSHFLMSVVGDQPNDEFGHEIVSGCDYDADGIPDFAVAGCMAKGGGYVRVYSGASGRPISFTYHPAAIDSGEFGTGLEWFPDVDGDAHPEIIAGAPASGSGAVYLLASKNSGVLLSLRGDEEGDFFGQDVEVLPDVDGDGYVDLAVGAPGRFDARKSGYVAVFSGRTGVELFRLHGRAIANDRFGLVVKCPGDLNQDGVPDLLISAVGESANGCHCGAIYGISLKDRSILFRVDGKKTQDQLGHELATGPDFDDDGVPDFLAAANSLNGGGRAVLLSGRTGESIRVFADSSADFPFHDVVFCGDQDGDGHLDIACGAPDVPLDGAKSVGAVFLFSGQTGDLLATYRGLRSRGLFGYRVCAIGDLDHDGNGDLLIGHCLVGGTTPGQVVVLGSSEQR